MSRIESCAWSPIIALQLLTRLPTPAVPARLYEADNPARRYSLVFFPVIGALVGLASGLTMLAANPIGLHGLAAAAVAIAVAALLTGGFHEDGLADVADSLGKLDRESALEVMRDSRIGSFGALALWVALTVKASTMSSIGPHWIVAAMVAAGAVSRATPLLMVSLLPPARKDAGRSSVAVIDCGWIQAVVGAAIALAVAYKIVGPGESLNAAGIAMALVAATALFYKWRFGGYTGDCLGATVLISEIALLCLFANAHR